MNLLDTDSARSVALRYQPEMESDDYKFITSFHLNGTKNELESLLLKLTIIKS